MVSRPLEISAPRMDQSKSVQIPYNSENNDRGKKEERYQESKTDINPIVKSDIREAMTPKPRSSLLFSDMSSGDMCGFLEIRVKGKSNWVLFWFSLQKDSLLFFSNKQDVKPKGIILLVSCTAKTIQLKDKKFTLELLSPNETVYLSAESYASMLEWIKSINDTAKKLIQENSDFKTPLRSEKAGHLYKQSPSALKGFQKRWFMLSGSVLYYWKTQQTRGKPISAILLNESRIVPIYDKKGTFEIHTEDRKYVLYADTAEESKVWIEVLSSKAESKQYERGYSAILNSNEKMDDRKRSSSI